MGVAFQQQNDFFKFANGPCFIPTKQTNMNMQHKPPEKMKRIFEGWNSPNFPNFGLPYQNFQFTNKMPATQPNQQNPRKFVMEPFNPSIPQAANNQQASCILCEICQKIIISNKFRNHMNAHKAIGINNNVNNAPGARNHSAGINRVIRIEDIEQNLQDFRPFNEGIPPIRIFEPQQRRIFLPREQMTRVHADKRRKHKRFKEKEIEMLFPLVKYEAEKNKNLDEESKKCSICLGDFEDGEMIRFLACLHRFHQDCIDAWLAKNINCPVCKKDLIKLTKLAQKFTK